MALAGCSESTGPLEGDLFLRFEANGALVEFTNQQSLLAVFGSTGGQFFLRVGGFDGVSDAGAQVYDPQPIETRTYTGFRASGSSGPGVALEYRPVTGPRFEPDPSAADDGTVTITAIDTRRVRGTFSGTLSATGEADVVVTGGEFLVARTN